LQQVVLAIRQVRADHAVPPRETVPVFVDRDLADDARQAVELWATCRFGPSGSLESPVEAVAGGVAVFVGGVVDPAADAERIARETAELEKSIKALRGRLGNKGYTEKAPPHLVQQTRDQLATAEADLARLTG
jgi:valyl-tRNA synthetase